jgi:glycosyltransferase involved in cell wall biosynthesis
MLRQTRELQQKHCKVLFVVTEDHYFCSHRLALATGAKNAGFDVALATRENGHGESIRRAGIRLLPLPMERTSMAPRRELDAIGKLTALYRAEAPDIVHHVAMKPIIYGTIAARRAGVPFVVNTVAGFGFTESSSSFLAAMLRPGMRAALRHSFNMPRSRIIVQNPTDRNHVVQGLGIDGRRVVLIPGSGVDLNEFHYSAEPAGTPLFLLATRMLRDKGVCEFIEAAEIVRRRGIAVRYVAAGDVDPKNPASLEPAYLRAQCAARAIEWIGHCNDIAALMRQSNVVVLPSYREGLPKVLIEAAAAGRAILTTDVPGCRDVVTDGVHGLLVPAKNAQALADRICELATDPERRARMGAAARARAVEMFGIESIVRQTLTIYEDMIAPLGSDSAVNGPTGPIGDATEDPPMVSVVMPVFNEERFLQKCLDSVLASTFPLDRVQMIVVDGGSTDRSREIAAERGKRFPHFLLLDNPGRLQSPALNIGLQHARGDYVVRLDAHEEYPPNYLRTCLEELEITHADNVGGIWITKPGADTVIGRSIAYASQHPLVVGPAKYRLGWADRWVDSVPFGAFRRELFDRIGNFREALARGEDFEFNARIRANGGKVFLSSKLHSIYYNVPTWRRFLRQAFLNGWYISYSLLEYPATFSLRHLAPLAMVVIILLTAAAGIHFGPGLAAFYGVLGAYLVAATFAGTQIARRHGWIYLAVTPLLITSYHLTYGIAELLGFIAYPFRSSAKREKESIKSILPER